MTKRNWKVWAVAIPSALVVSCCTLGAIVGKPKTPAALTVTPVATVSVTIARATEAPTWTPVPTVQATLEPTATAEPTVAIPTATAVAIAPAAPTAVAQTGGAVSGSDSFPCADGQIKGNINSKKYHIPSGQSYAKTVENVICFDTAAEAEAAGFIRAKR